MALLCVLDNFRRTYLDACDGQVVFRMSSIPEVPEAIAALTSVIVSDPGNWFRRCIPAIALRKGRLLSVFGIGGKSFDHCVLDSLAVSVGLRDRFVSIVSIGPNDNYRNDCLYIYSIGSDYTLIDGLPCVFECSLFSSAQGFRRHCKLVQR